MRKTTGDGGQRSELWSRIQRLELTWGREGGAVP
jgi:hypothetical protein